MRNFAILLLFLSIAGLSVKAEQWTFHRLIDVRTSSILNDITGQDPWIRCSTGLVAHFENDTWKGLFYDRDYYPAQMKPGIRNRIWALRKEMLYLYFYEHNTWDSIPFHDSMSDYSTLFVDAAGVPVVSSNGRLWILNGEEFTKVEYKDPEGKVPYFSTLLFDQENNWYGYDGKAVVVNPQREHPQRYAFNSPGSLRKVEGGDIFFFWKNNNMLCIYHGDSLVKVINRPGQYSLPSNGLQIISQDEVYFHYAGWSEHYMNGSIQVDSLEKGAHFIWAYCGGRGINWILTSKGLVMRTADSTHTFRTPELGLRSMNLLQAVPMGESTMIGYCDSLPTLYQHGRYFHFDSTIGFKRTTDMQAGRQGEVWVIGNDSLFCYRNGRWSMVKRDGHGVPAQAIQTLRGGDLVILSGKKILRYDGGNSWLETEFPYTEFHNPWIKASHWLEGKNGELWLSLNKRGLYRYESGKWTEYTVDIAPPFYLDNVVAMGIDRQGMFYGVTCNTIVTFDGHTWEGLDTNNSNTRMFWPGSLAIDAQNLIWVGDIESGAVEYYDGQKFYPLKNAPFRDVYRIQTDQDNNKWFFCEGQISIYNEKDKPEEPISSVTESVFFYPNPVSSSVTIQTLLSGDHIQLFDLSGRSMLQATADRDGSQELSLQSIGRGFYLLQVTRKGQACLQSALLKQ